MVAPRKYLAGILHRRLRFAEAGKRTEEPPRQKQSGFRRIVVGKVSLVVAHLVRRPKAYSHKEGAKSHGLFSSKCTNSRRCEAASFLPLYRRKLSRSRTARKRLLENRDFRLRQLQIPSARIFLRMLGCG